VRGAIVVLGGEGRVLEAHDMPTLADGRVRAAPRGNASAAKRCGFPRSYPRPSSSSRSA
jgi:hypothetical protein